MEVKILVQQKEFIILPIVVMGAQGVAVRIPIIVAWCKQHQTFNDLHNVQVDFGLARTADAVRPEQHFEQQKGQNLL